MGVLRHLRRLDATLATALKQPVGALEAEVAVTLRLGVFEVVEMGIPAAVAGDSAVRLIRTLGKGRAAGLVNAVMRRAPANWQSVGSAGDPGLRCSHPDWLWQRWQKTWGRDAAALSVESDQQPAPMWVWFRSEEALDTVRAEGVELVPHPWVPDAWRSTGNNLISSLLAGDAYAQDPASQLVAHLATVAGEPGGSLLDLCAAPGGKAARVARFGDRDMVVACDLHVGRLRLARDLFAVSAGEVVVAIAQDASRTAVSPCRWPVVVLDAPCSGTGTLRRHPELRWRLAPTDIVERATLQRRLIDSALELVAVGGLLIYSTCSVEPEENEQHFASVPGGFAVEPLEKLLPPGTPAQPTAAGGVLLRPQNECDGFTIHALKKIR